MRLLNLTNENEYLKNKRIIFIYKKRENDDAYFNYFI